jgi:hypothetical protein
LTQGYDYLAAPWFKGFSEDHTAGLWRVGNGGLSLRKVSSALRILSEQIPVWAIYPRWGHYAWKPLLESWESGFYRKYAVLHDMICKRALHPVEEELSKFPYNEDVFWAIEAPKFDADFRVAPAEEALGFAFEVAPRWCLEYTNGNMPFGCHAWSRYDREFWEDKNRQ